MSVVKTIEITSYEVYAIIECLEYKKDNEGLTLYDERLLKRMKKLLELMGNS